MEYHTLRPEEIREKQKFKLIRPAYTLFVKTGPACNAGCVSCPSGRKQLGDIEKIPLMTGAAFAMILDRVAEQGSILSVVLHYYNEPSLNPHIPDVVRVAKDRKITTVMSTNGSRPEILRKAYVEGIDNLIFSLSGFTQSVHERSHKGVDIEVVKNSMAEIAQLRDESFPGNYIKAAWHDYAYNRHERKAMESYCHQIGVHFDPYQTGVLPLNIVTDRFFELSAGKVGLPELPAERDLYTKLPEARLLCEERKHWRCSYHDRMFAVDGNGDVTLCAADLPSANNSNIMGNVFSHTLEELNEFRKNSEWCKRCKSIGAHIYGTQKYRTPIGLKHDIRRHVEDKWRDFGMSAKFPWVAKKLGALLYERPRNGDKS